MILENTNTGNFMSAPKVISNIFSESYDIQKDQEPLARNAFEGAETWEI